MTCLSTTTKSHSQYCDFQLSVPNNGTIYLKRAQWWSSPTEYRKSPRRALHLQLWADALDYKLFNNIFNYVIRCLLWCILTRITILDVILNEHSIYNQ